MQFTSPKAGVFYFDLTVALLAMVANIFVLIALKKNQAKFRQRQGYRSFLVSLASCDLLGSCINVIAMLFQIFNTFPSFVPSFFKCIGNALRTLQLVVFFINLLNLSAMSVDQFFSVVYPIKYRQVMSLKIIKTVILVIWLSSAFLGKFQNFASKLVPECFFL